MAKLEIDWKNEVVVIKGVKCYPEGYDIDFSGFHNEKSLQFWLDHLSHKNWFTPEIEEDLIEMFNYFHSKE